MKKATQKFIRSFVANKIATDITTAENLPSGLQAIMYSVGTYGVNAALFEDEHGDLFAVTARTTNLFRLL